jgi:hypothetical protein
MLGQPEPRRLNVRNVSATQFGHLIHSGPKEGVAEQFKRPDLGDTAVPRTAHGRMAINTEKAEPIRFVGWSGHDELQMPWHTTKYFEDPHQRKDGQW